jgi:hypothetical protein
MGQKKQKSQDHGSNLYHGVMKCKKEKKLRGGQKKKG